jgi:hypothetical protein
LPRIEGLFLGLAHFLDASRQVAPAIQRCGGLL